MTKLVAFGCSFTYGTALPDATDVNPSKLAWPALVAEKMNMAHVNAGVPGASNDLILHNIINFENFNKGDHVIVVWTFMHRALLFDDTGNTNSIMPNRIMLSKANGNPEWEQFYKVHGDYDLYIRTLKNMHHAMCYLSSKEIRMTNLSIDLWQLPWKNVQTNYKKNMDVDVTFIDVKKSKVDTGSDGLHPGVQTHMKLADIIHNLHKEKHEQY